MLRPTRTPGFEADSREHRRSKSAAITDLVASMDGLPPRRSISQMSEALAEPIIVTTDAD